MYLLVTFWGKLPPPPSPSEQPQDIISSCNVLKETLTAQSTHARGHWNVFDWWHAPMNHCKMYIGCSEKVSISLPTHTTSHECCCHSYRACTRGTHGITSTIILVVVVVVVVCVVGGEGGAELFPCTYPPKVQARPSRDQRPANQSGVSGHLGFIWLVKCHI